MAAGAKVVSGEREIGVVTSAAESSALGPIALAYVHRDFTPAGTGVQVNGHPAAVTGLPMA
jgi:glycine cleavage system aminomethyltransferase T